MRLLLRVVGKSRRPWGCAPGPLSFLSLAIKYKVVLVAGMLFGLLLGSAISLMQTRTFRAENNIEV